MKHLSAVFLCTLLFSALLFSTVSHAETDVKTTTSSLLLAVSEVRTLVLPKNVNVFSYTSKDTRVATVTNKGKVTARAKGKTTITARSGNNRYIWNVTVSTYRIDRKSSTITTNDTLKLSLIGNTKGKMITWKSSDTSVATVSKAGMVTPKNVGVCIISATEKRVRMSFKLTVTAPKPSVPPPTAEKPLVPPEIPPVVTPPEVIPPVVTPPTLPDDMSKITSTELVAQIKMGWSLGNTLDCAVPTWIKNSTVRDTETAWGNVPTTKGLFTSLKDKGFNAIRIPVSWYNHFSMTAPYTIDAAWMARVKEVVDYAYSQGLYVILNSHHDTAWQLLDKESLPTTKEMLAAVWGGIAETFKDYDYHLLFEGLNEPRTVGSANEWDGGTAETRESINVLNKVFVDTVRKAGGNNPYRHLLICGNGASPSDNVLSAIKIPNNDSRVIISIHSYAPYNFALNKTGTDKWSKDNPTDVYELTYALNNGYKYFVSKGIPVIMGEMGAVNKENDAARAEWAAFYFAYAKSKGIPCFWWDNGEVKKASEKNGETFGIIDRTTYEFVY